jgi:hypothetical protein
VTRRHLVSFAGCAVAVDAADQSASDIVGFVFGDMPANTAVRPVAFFEVRPAAAGVGLQLTRAGTMLNVGDTPAAIAAHLACDVAQSIAECATGGLLLHAAAVAWESHGVVLPGPSGAGKTTMCAHLVHQGFCYLSDELAYLPDDTAGIDGFGRPLSLKPGAWPALEQELAATPSTADVMAIVDGFLVRPRRLNQQSARTRPRLSALVFPRRERGARDGVRRLSKAETALSLLANLVNARNLPDHGLAQVTRLAREVPAFEAVYDDARTMVPLIRSVLPSGTQDL